MSHGSDDGIASVSPPLFPFCGEGRDSEDFCSSGEWPFDHLCVIRFPEDVARRLSQQLEEVEKKTTGSAQALDVHLNARSGGGRHWEVRAFGETLYGTLVDLPRCVESHIVRQPESENADTVMYKSADITQLLVLHREKELPKTNIDMDHKTFKWSSGLTPCTQHIARRSFRECPFTPQELHETELALKAWSDGKAYTSEQKMEKTLEEIEEIRRNESEHIWKCPSSYSGEALSAPTSNDKQGVVEETTKKDLQGVKVREERRIRSISFKTVKKHNLIRVRALRRSSKIKGTKTSDGSVRYTF